MAPRFSRRRDPADEPAAEPGADDDDDADLGADEHAWWAQRDIEGAWTPHVRPEPEEEAPPRDVLADHFGADWRTSFGFDDPSGPVPSDPVPRDPVPNPAEPGPAGPAPEAPVPVIDTSDPYAVLDVDPTASWEEIVAAHRNQARRHHPDGLFGRSEAEVAAAEDRIRSINVAYQELRIRRGR